MGCIHENVWRHFKPVDDAVINFALALKRARAKLLFCLVLKPMAFFDVGVNVPALHPIIHNDSDVNKQLKVKR